MTDVTAAPPTILARLRETITDALRYWEPRRLIFNAVLACIVLGYFAAAWPESRSAVTLNGVLFLFILAVLANVCYCAAYLGDLFVQFSGFTAVWQKGRWILFVVGTLFAAAITRFFAMGFFSNS
jgi:hypothetical protein